MISPRLVVNPLPISNKGRLLNAVRCDGGRSLVRLAFWARLRIEFSAVVDPEEDLLDLLTYDLNKLMFHFFAHFWWKRPTRLQFTMNVTQMEDQVRILL